MGDLESLKDVTSFTLLSDALHDGVYEFGTFGVVTLGPVVTGSALAKNKVVGTEK
jgi:proteasome assembly chaperone (PAC2) family protein